MHYMNLEENTRLCRAKTKLLTDAGYQHWSSRGHSSLHVTAKKQTKTKNTPTVHHRLPLVTSKRNIKLITNSDILAALSILSADSESQALFNDSHTLTQLLT